jgi:hypothetical protein|tara:strand:+ start:112 stop:504 length:393 start_codon:yes stop_codon:yes gene_type:complete
MGKGGQSQNLNWPWAINYIIDRLKSLLTASSDINRIGYFKKYTAVATTTIADRFHNVTIYNAGAGATNVVTVQVLKTDATYDTAVTIPSGTAFTWDAGGNGNSYPASSFKIDITTAVGNVFVSGTIARTR